MKWKIFSRKKRKETWRLVFHPDGDAADVLALPGAVLEGRIAARFLLSSGQAGGTVIIQGVSRKGILAGVDVHVDAEAAVQQHVDVAFQPRSGRAGMLPADTISLEAMMLQSPDEFIAAPAEPDDLACILYTSGTTGRPKGVPLTVENIVTEQEASHRCLEITPEDRVIGVLPFFHVFGLSNVIHLALVHGASVILVPQYSPGNLLKTIIKNEPTLVIAIPTMFVHLEKMMAMKRARLPETIRLCVSGAAPLPVETMEAFQAASGARMLEGYGLTETVGACCLNPPAGESKPGSIGLPMPGFEMTIVDDQGEALPAGAVGEIAVRGKGVMAGYYGLSEETEKAFAGGWFLTGDTGFRDPEGYFFVTDRKKEIIIKAGFNVSPREVEAVLQQHPSVRLAAVVGRRKEEREEVVAFVTTREPITAKTLLDHCKKLLSQFKVPDEIRFVDALPMSLTGKVLKKELKDDFQDDRRIEHD